MKQPQPSPSTTLGIDTGFQVATEIQRRDFLKLTGLVATGLLMGIGTSTKASAPSGEKVFEPNVFLSI